MEGVTGCGGQRPFRLRTSPGQSYW